MSSKSNQAACGAGTGVIWLIGWLFTIAYAELSFWTSVLGLLIWPYYLGVAVR